MTNLTISLSEFHPFRYQRGSDTAPERTGHLHLAGRGSDKITIALHGDTLHIPRFASHDGAWHAWADDLHGLTPPTPTSDHDG
jgi:hypothetical protein